MECKRPVEVYARSIDKAKMIAVLFVAGDRAFPRTASEARDD
jgi:hypothetical protein